MKEKFRFLLNILPLLLIGVILFLSAAMFNLNKQQTYERVKTLKESQVRIIANQVDSRIRLTGEGLDKESAEILKNLVEDINEQEGVYCYLFDKECNLISNFSRQHKHETGEALIDALKTADSDHNLKILFTHEYYGYIEVSTNNQQDFEVYWQGLPSGARSECEYFIILSVSENEIQENEAIKSCKIMIALLTMGLGISLYSNLYVPALFNEKSKKD